MGLKTTAAVFLIAASAVLPSRAGVVVGSFDPAFGPAYPNLGFRGTLTVNVPDACFNQPAGFISNTDACSGGQMSVLSASVQLYNLNTPGLPTVYTLNFAPASFLVSYIVTGFDIDTQSNQMLGLSTSTSTTLMASFFDPGPTAGAGDDLLFVNAGFSLNFFAFLSEPSAMSADASTPNPNYGTQLNICSTSVVTLTAGVQCVTPTNTQSASTVFAAVPEPGSAALALLALLALGVTARRPRS